MCFKHIAFAFTYCVIFQCGFIKSDDEKQKSKEENEDQDDKTRFESHTFVALIDIVFADGTKRTCTGSIIHDNVVITAAHCFVHEFDDHIKPELTTSFVVIGSKKMFDTGYEQYLPIERILTHPKFHGWTADLSLVFTFAGMTSDKPGKKIPLAGERMSNPVDSNVTVFSWGHCKEEEVTEHSKKKTAAPCSDSSNEESAHKFTANIDSQRARDHKSPNLQESEIEESKSTKFTKLTTTRQKHRFQTEDYKNQQRNFQYQYPFLQHKLRDKEPVEPKLESKKSTTKKLSLYLSSEESSDDPEVNMRSRHSTKSSSEPINSIKSFYKNWRRYMGSLKNKLTVEKFGFMNLATCKKIVDGSALPNRYEIKNGEVACYASEDHYLTDDDAGAPAVRHGQLVAVTVGGAQCDGDHVGVGMKMSCYCNWIADNLPGGGADMNCCKNCCDVNSRHTEDSGARAMHRNKHRI